MPNFDLGRLLVEKHSAKDAAGESKSSDAPARAKNAKSGSSGSSSGGGGGGGGGSSSSSSGGGGGGRSGGTGEEGGGGGGKSVDSKTSGRGSKKPLERADSELSSFMDGKGDRKVVVR